MSSVDGLHLESTEIINLTDNTDPLPSSSRSQDLTPSLANDPSTTIGSSLSSAYDASSYQPRVGPLDDTPADGRSSDADKMFQSTIEGSSTSEQHPQHEGELGDVSDGPVLLMQANGVEVSDHVNGSDDGRQWEAEEGHDLKRVKVYELIGARWVDQGTAFCFGDFHDGEALLIARSETNYDQIILTTSIKPTDVYQRQQDTLIVWTEPDGVDYALSFQDPDGCAEVWNFIQEVQRHMALPDPALSSSPQPGEGFVPGIFRTGRLPQPTLGNIGEIEKIIKTNTRLQPSKERVCEFIQSEGYIKSLIDVLTQAEDLESIEVLHALCVCMQTILMLNDHTMYEHILDDSMFLGVVGMLEYDPEFPIHKANYREFLRGTAHYHQPVPLRNEAIQRKVHHTYRLQFLKDVVLARAIDDSTFNVLNSCIIFNQIDIINHIQSDPAFLREVVGMFMSDDLLAKLGTGFAAGAAGAVKGKEPERDKSKGDTGEGNETKMDVDTPPVSAADAELARRREVVFLIQQLCVMGKNVQLPARMQLFRTLTDRGILFAVQWALGQPEESEEGKSVIAAAGEILTALLDHDLNGVRGHVVKQLSVLDKEAGTGKKLSGDTDKDTVLMLLCRVIVRSKEMAVQGQVAEALKMVMEIPSTVEPPPMVGPKVFQRPKDDPATEKFLDYFYKHCVEVLFRPFFDIPEYSRLTESTLPLSRERTNLLLHLCELLANFALQHSFRSHFYMLSTGIATRVASLLSSKDKHLRLAAFRFFRVLLRLNNRNLFLNMIKTDLLKPILDLTIQESRRDNLLSSSCQEFFEHLRRENIKELIQHCMTKHEDKIKILAESALGRPRFEAFIRRYEMNIEPPPKEEEKADDKPAANGPRRWGQGRLMEVEEEDYFNADDDDDEIVPVPTASPAFPRGVVTPPLKRKRTRGPSVGSSQRPSKSSLLGAVPPVRTTPPQSTPPLGGLVDYGDDDDLASPDPTTPSSPKNTMPPGLLPGSPSMPPSPRLSHRQIPSKPPITVPSLAVPILTTPEDEEDLLLESLLTKGGPSPPSLLNTRPPPDIPLGLKRRREEDDDELLVLANKSKRQSMGSGLKEKMRIAVEGLGAGEGETGKSSLAKSVAEEGPKKIKLKLASSAAATLAPSSTGAKDGDTG
ncbi:component of IIS longevity pathway SMK-1-domain-containing protein [Cristinia sonorae]|uniref:Component of IIS longevity pathway SMK-1-domain-containing protein n=1 Tax=Cristinia sonorae TaxID=1940300 RepID=A0A8K0UKW6_9AGAR|nr:component of IIS longevity pathway SMK-1-domain-containing protein [Cristinia sonorae]